MEKCKVAVIGSNSFSGSDFIDLLLEDDNNDVIGISRSPEKSSLFLSYKKHSNPNFTFYQMDLNKDVDKILQLFDSFKPDYIVNFAAQSEVAPSWEHPEHWFQTNVVSLSHLMNALKNSKYLRRYIHISSPEVYGTCTGKVTEDTPLNPSTPYAASKAAADMFLFTLVKNYNFPMVMIRATNVYGPHQQLWKIIPRSAIYLNIGRKIQLHGGGAAVKSFIHIRDVSRGELCAMNHGRPGEIYHLSPDNSGYSVRDVVQRVCKARGRVFDECIENVGERLGQDAAYVIDSTKAREELGWRPQVSINNGIKEVVDWVDGNINSFSNENLDYIHIR
jgi:dTDP-glucose 4,6-dehydratase